MAAKKKSRGRLKDKPGKAHARRAHAPRMTRRAVLALIAILAVGGLLRGFYIAELTHAPDFSAPFSDAGYHDYWARGLAFGRWAPPPNEANPEIATSPYLRPPGYPYFLALVYRVAGPGYLAPRIVQGLLGLLSAWLAFLLTRRWFGTAPALVAAFIMSVYWAFIYYEGEFHAPAILIPLLLAFTAVVARWTEKATALLGLAAGVLLGLAAITRPNVLIFLPAVALWGLWLKRRARSRSGLGPALVGLLIGTVIAVLPVTIRNFVASGEFVPITSNTGVNLFMGNNADANGLCDGDLPGIGDFGTCFDYPAVITELERQLGRRLTGGEVSNILAGRAIEFVLHDPGQALRLAVRKALLFWGPWEVTHNKVVELERTSSRVLSGVPINFPFVAALGVLGGLMLLLPQARRTRRAGERRGLSDSGTKGGAGGPTSVSRPWGGEAGVESSTEVGGLVVALAAAWFVSILPFFVAARYRVPMIPFLVILGAVGICRVAWLVRIRELKSVVLWVAVAAVLFTLASIRFVPYRADPARWHYNRGMSYAATGDFGKAIAEYRAAIKANPNNWQAHLDLGVALARAGRLNEAGPHLAEALRARPDNPFIHYNMALLLEAFGQLDQSEQHLLEVLRIDPRFPGARKELERVRAAMHKTGEGVPTRQ
jgi:4-amino-4-deoxy-L-arabinose transferase-like glycosyltransferase